MRCKYTSSFNFSAFLICTFLAVGPILAKFFKFEAFPRVVVLIAEAFG